ncbi:PIN domain-containing protein [Sphingomonas solaris]|uniref:Ribonuclease VapC n=1 Tax=Alterirhizorhabdus solaris TaxID=2529389 RepID=A0A558R098_9SPHN|nr:PIN domain-containing protein [Sphingomonas solaris]TVV72758.1 type II toxin-antitoxin system VapC family toxin [Sphingomonas solaris]
MLHLLDIDTASYIIKRGSEALADRLRQLDPADVAISAVTGAELVYGLKRIDPAHRLHALVGQFLDTIQILPWTGAAADHYADIRHQLTTEGQPIGDMDMMIAGHALALRATLVTNNQRHFSRLAAPLLLENWIE